MPVETQKNRDLTPSTLRQKREDRARLNFAKKDATLREAAKRMADADLRVGKRLSGR